MSKKRKVVWFSPNFTPTRKGFYVISAGSIFADPRMVLWRWWDGAQWLSGAWAVIAPQPGRLSCTKRATKQRVRWAGLV